MRTSSFLLLVLFSLSTLAAQRTKYKDQWMIPPGDSSSLVTAEEQLSLMASEEEMAWFKDAKLGLFVHWGPALQVTSTLSWGRDGERPAANKAANGGVPAAIYDQQYLSFNPVNFDADQWMEQVRAFGAQYLVFTAKHHDGFCMFDAPNTDYDIMNTPFGRDICRELSIAAQKHGIKLFWYYSQPDWTHPDCLREKHYENYLPYMKEQVEHLFTNYGRIDGVFWDGIASKYWHWDTYHLMQNMKEWQPGLLSNPRGGFGWPKADLRGDFDTPEQSLGPINHDRYWEACLTMTDKWLYSPKGPIKTAETVLGMLIQVNCNGGNLLLNLGPDGKGEFVSAEAEEARKVGEWLNEYGHTLYGTRRGIYMGGDWGGSTQKDNKLYLHILEKIADNGKAVIELPNLPTAIVTAKGITPGFLQHEVRDGKLFLSFDPTAFRQNLDNIVELVLAEAPATFERISTWEAEPLSADHYTITASSFKDTKHRPEAIYTSQKNVFSEGIRLKTWWQPDSSDQTPSLSLSLKAPLAIQTILLSENMRSHSVRSFVIETQDQQGNWQAVFEGNAIGEGLRIKLNGDLIYGTRIRILSSRYTTQLTAFNIYE